MLGDPRNLKNAEMALTPAQIPACYVGSWTVNNCAGTEVVYCSLVPKIGGNKQKNKIKQTPENKENKEISPQFSEIWVYFGTNSLEKR